MRGSHTVRNNVFVAKQVRPRSTTDRYHSPPSGPPQGDDRERPDVTDDLTIRRYRPGDEAALRELQRVALTGADAYFGEGAVDEDLGRVESVYLDAGGEFLVGEIGGEIVASGAVRRPSDVVRDLLGGVDAAAVAELKRFYVHPERHRRGIGQAIYDDLERKARELGYEALVAETTARQTAARRFYEANGFDETLREAAESDGECYEMLVYRTSLR